MIGPRVVPRDGFEPSPQRFKGVRPCRWTTSARESEESEGWEAHGLHELESDLPALFLFSFSCSPRRTIRLQGLDRRSSRYGRNRTVMTALMRGVFRLGSQRRNGAVNGNRTRIPSVAGSRSALELSPQVTSTGDVVEPSEGFA